MFAFQDMSGGFTLNNFAMVRQGFLTKDMFGINLGASLLRSFILWIVGEGLIFPISLITTYVLTRKILGHYIFRIIYIVPSLMGAIIALLSAAAATVGVMMLFNLWVTPYYMGVAVETVKSMIPTLLLPFNMVKSCMNVGFVLLLYKPISTVMQRMKLIEKHTQQQKLDWRTFAVAGLALVLIAASLGVVIGVLGGSFEWR